MLRLTVRVALAAVLLLSVGVGSAWAGSCCGGAAGPSLIVPRLFTARADLSFSWESYDGFWNMDGVQMPDPPGSDLNQYRLNLGYAHRLSPSWQLFGSLPYVWNDNRYSGVDSQTSGLGDANLGFWWEAFAGTLYLGSALTLPTGISPYDDLDSSFDVTGRGFYLLDFNLLAEKTLGPWDFMLRLGLGYHFERSVNREYGSYVEPYRKDLGDRYSASGVISYTHAASSGRWTGTGGFSYLKETEARFDGHLDPTSGFTKTALLAGVAYATTDRVWTVRLGWEGSVRRDDWGENFPITDVYTLGVSHAFR